MLHQYFIKTPWIVKKIFFSYAWSMPANEKAIYLSFDDGPHPTITPFVLDELKKYGAVATFFCIGDNVRKYPDVYERIITEGHAVGNHTYHHLNGWKTDVSTYLNDIAKAAELIDSNLFRPPYGRIKKMQARKIAAAINKTSAKIIMWDVLSTDFDSTITKEQCLRNVLQHAKAGSIIVFHDSEKAFPNLQFVLPIVMKQFAEEGYLFKKLEM